MSGLLSSVIAEEVRKRRKLTAILVAAALANAALVALVLSAIDWTLGVVTLVLLALWCLGSYLFYARMVLRLTGARPPTAAEASRLHPIVQRLSTRAGIPMPRIMVFDDEAANAYAVGLKPEKAAVAFSTGLLRLLDDEELEGVAAHEISHIAEGDTRMAIYVAGLLGWAVVVSFVSVAVAFGLAAGALSAASGGDSRDSSGTLAMWLVGLIMIVVGIFVFVGTQVWVLIARGAHLGISRQREWLADARAADYTGNPLGLAHALEKLAHADVVLANGRRTAQSLCIAGEPRSGRWWKDLFRTHPSIEIRIRRLYEYAGWSQPQGQAYAQRPVQAEEVLDIGWADLREAVPPSAPLAVAQAGKDVIEIGPEDLGGQTESEPGVVSRLKDRCPRCGAEVSEGQAFCQTCGASLSEAASQFTDRGPRRAGGQFPGR
jgi:heat shock protein HtpX